MSQDESDAPLGQFDGGEDVYAAFDDDGQLVGVYHTSERADAALKDRGATRRDVRVTGLYR